MTQSKKKRVQNDTPVSNMTHPQEAKNHDSVAVSVHSYCAWRRLRLLLGDLLVRLSQFVALSEIDARYCRLLLFCVVLWLAFLVSTTLFGGRPN